MPDKQPRRRSNVSLDLDSGIRCRVILQVYERDRQNYRGEATVRFTVPRRAETRRIWAALVRAIESARPDHDPVDRGVDAAASA